MLETVAILLLLLCYVASRFPREAASNYTYKGITIPKGAGIHIQSYLLHMKSEYWKEPEKFDPQRYVRLSIKQPINF